jgi:S-adenosylmethionine-diacylglycerol 3-amino-3-carboxypropyl transferase
MAVTRDAASGEAISGRPAKKNVRLKQAVHRHKATSRAGMSERVFTAMFSGLVYPQIWEDPVVDLEAMRLQPGEHVVAIMSGGCNIQSYVAAVPCRITAVDLNPAHVALNKLKATAAAKLPDYEAFHRFFAEADSDQNVTAYDTYLKAHLDPVTRAYWEGRDNLGRKRIGYFANNLYKHGLLGRFIGAGHTLARMHGCDLRQVLKAKSRAEQREIFDRDIGPLFRKPHIRWLCERPSALFGLGIPPAQFEALKGDEQYMADVLYKRVERLICDFDFKDNYFAWQAFGRRYASGGAGPLPPYLQRENFAAVRERAPGIEILHRSFTEYLADQAPGTCDAFVLLDAQDWMTDEQLTALWTEIARTSKPGSRVIFRTAGEDTILPGRVPDAILDRFSYDEEACREMTLRDRSSIYGGFHLYVFEG